jgi:RNA polymerase sigma-70 factor, ECF subfamily
MQKDTSHLLPLLANDLDRNFEVFVLVYQQQLYPFLLYQIGSPQETEDVLQEVFLQIYYALKRYPAERIQALRLRPWVYKIARNVWYNRLRENKIQEVSSEFVEETQWLEREDDVAYQPEMMVEQWENRRELEMAIAQLPFLYREVITLYYLEHFKYQEIAYQLNQSMGTIKARLHRGIQRLRQIYDTTTYERRSMNGPNAAK